MYNSYELGNTNAFSTQIKYKEAIINNSIIIDIYACTD